MNKTQLKELFKKFSFFNEIEESRIDELCDNTNVVELETDAVLFRKGEPCHKGMYLITDGEILVENPDSNISYKVSAGDVVGITAFLGRRTYAVTAISLAQSELIFLPDI